MFLAKTEFWRSERNATIAPCRVSLQFMFLLHVAHSDSGLDANVGSTTLYDTAPNSNAVKF